MHVYSCFHNCNVMHLRLWCHQLTYSRSLPWSWLSCNYWKVWKLAVSATVALKLRSKLLSACYLFEVGKIETKVELCGKTVLFSCVILMTLCNYIYIVSKVIMLESTGRKLNGKDQDICINWWFHTSLNKSPDKSLVHRLSTDSSARQGLRLGTTEKPW